MLMRLEDEKSFLRNNCCQFVTVIQYRECQCYDTTQIDTQFVALRIVAYWVFLYLNLEINIEEPETGSSFINIRK
jgi:hypothetical protein